VLLELRDTPPGKLNARWPSRPEVAEDERNQAFRLLREYEKYQQSRMPPSIKAANDLLNRLRGVWLQLVGYNAKFLSTAAFALAHLEGDPRRPDAVGPWSLDDAWVQRYLPSSANSFRLPGWTPTIAKSPMTNVRLRAPKGG
jgi:hypothetical protein